jgi:putative heme-binding domain-containing protein
LPLDDVHALVDPAKGLLSDPMQGIAVRQAAVGFLANASTTEAAPAFLKLLDPREPAELQQTAIRLLASVSDTRAIENLLTPDRWQALGPSTRSVVITTLLGQPRHALTLLNAVESGQIPASVFTSRQRDQLRQHSDSVVRERAQKLLAASAGDRMKAYEASKAALEFKGDPTNGRKIFGNLCASCHRLDQQGVIVGPELVAMRRQTKEVILLHVVHPNYEVTPSFAAYEAETNDGRTLTGLLASETPTSITLRQAQGLEETIPRVDMKKLTASALSLMPDELEKNLTMQELADLLAHLRGE